LPRSAPVSSFKDELVNLLAGRSCPAAVRL
jgi:hypothetical protein